MSENNIRNSDILFIYEALLCNPNGDPDDENRPRMDWKTMRNLVSDVRLKRFFRDYLIDLLGWEKVWVTKTDEGHVTATDRVRKITDSKDADEVLKKVLETCVDARLFGATIPYKGEGRGESISIIGPVQFTWGFSLHKVDLVDSSAITSIFKGREVEAQAGTIGRDYRVYYSMLAFYGRVNSKRAVDAMTKPEDIEYIDRYLWEAVKTESTTRSKIGHNPLLYLRLEYRDNFYEGDLRRYIKTEADENVRSMDDVELDFKPLLDMLRNRLDRIEKAILKVDRLFDERYNVSELFKEALDKKLSLEIL